jgi:hypothetical protein
LQRTTLASAIAAAEGETLEGQARTEGSRLTSRKDFVGKKVNSMAEFVARALELRSELDCGSDGPWFRGVADARAQYPLHAAV